jgi:hypothetical protein
VERKPERRCLRDGFTRHSQDLRDKRDAEDW